MPTEYTIFSVQVNATDATDEMYRIVGLQTAASPSAALRAHFNDNANEIGDEFLIIPTSNMHRRTAQVETRRQLTIQEAT